MTDDLADTIISDRLRGPERLAAVEYFAVVASACYEVALRRGRAR